MIFAINLPSQPFLGCHLGFHILFSWGPHTFLQLGCFWIRFNYLYFPIEVDILTKLRWGCLFKWLRLQNTITVNHSIWCYFHWKESAATLVFSWLDPPLYMTSWFEDIEFWVSRPYYWVTLKSDERLLRTSLTSGVKYEILNTSSPQYFFWIAPIYEIAFIQYISSMSLHLLCGLRTNSSLEN